MEISNRLSHPNRLEIFRNGLDNRDDLEDHMETRLTSVHKKPNSTETILLNFDTSLLLTNSPTTSFNPNKIKYFFPFDKKRKKKRVVLLKRWLIPKIILTDKNRLDVISLSLLGITRKHKAPKHYFLSFTKRTYCHLI